MSQRVILFLYHLSFILLLPGIAIFILLKLRGKDYVPNFFERFGHLKNLRLSETGRVPEGRGQNAGSSAPAACFWFHAVSAGEVMAAIPLVGALRSRYPGCRMVFSTTTPAGRAILAASRVTVDDIFYSPIDSIWLVRRVVARVAPTLFVLVETDLWPALLHQLARRGVPSVLVNGRISLRRAKFGCFFRPVFDLLSHICVQTDGDAKRLIGMGINSDKVTVTGNLKFAQALVQVDELPGSEAKFVLPSGSVLLIAGSTHEGEEEQILDSYSRLREKGIDILLMIAPRHIERLKVVEDLIAARGFSNQRWSVFDGWERDRIALVDSVGRLPQLYRLGHFVFVGGSLVKRGGHNLLEPAAWGKPVFFGPHMENYGSIAEALEREGGASRVSDGADLAAKIEKLLKDPGKSAVMGRAARALVAKNQGVVERNVNIIESILCKNPKPLSPGA